MTKEERRTKKELMNIVYPYQLKYLKKLKSEWKRYKGMKPRSNWKPFKKKK